MEDRLSEGDFNEMFEGSRLVFGCCFCNEDIADPDMEGQVVLVFKNPDINENMEQTWWCHLECFMGSLHELFREPSPELAQRIAEQRGEIDADL